MKGAIEEANEQLRAAAREETNQTLQTLADLREADEQHHSENKALFAQAKADLETMHTELADQENQNEQKMQADMETRQAEVLEQLGQLAAQLEQLAAREEENHAAFLAKIKEICELLGAAIVIQTIVLAAVMVCVTCFM